MFWESLVILVLFLKWVKSAIQPFASKFEHRTPPCVLWRHYAGLPWARLPVASRHNASQMHLDGITALSSARRTVSAAWTQVSERTGDDGLSRGTALQSCSVPQVWVTSQTEEGIIALNYFKFPFSTFHTSRFEEHWFKSCVANCTFL